VNLYKIQRKGAKPQGKSIKSGGFVLKSIGQSLVKESGSELGYATQGLCSQSISTTTNRDPSVAENRSLRATQW
jgi:hypothetical protein